MYRLQQHAKVDVFAVVFSGQHFETVLSHDRKQLQCWYPIFTNPNQACLSLQAGQSYATSFQVNKQAEASRAPFGARCSSIAR
ncbi:hypothetical protein AC244_17955 [Ensifer adhaerens]|uniref:Uncharacterized protein n=1 Tax=Ensifer adhaerens TaxID=106592 RepID=A0A0L8BS49_ENSAD|nr:hypothetical protein AC244_17955 [Ensifer adhaerens]